MIATEKNQQLIVKQLLEHDFNVEHENNYGITAIDLAWNNFVKEKNEDVKKKIDAIMMCLLNANSRYPSKFDYNTASKGVTDFINRCERLHSDVDDNKLDSLKLMLESTPYLSHFYNRNNESLLAHALKLKKFKIFEIFNKEIKIGRHEDLEEIYVNMKENERHILRNQSLQNEFQEIHILILKTKCKISHNERLFNDCWKFIDEAFDTLNRNEYCKKIIKVAAEFKKLSIYFDFKHDSTYYMDSATSIYSKGIIYIGAKFLPDDEKKFAVFGVLAHELCHLAVFMAFANRNFDPFPLGESDQKIRFIDQVIVQCKERAGSENIVENVLVSYPKDFQNSEMIVTVPQMLMHYIGNPAKIQELEKKFEKLFRYSREVVEPELKKALPVLKILNDEDRSIKFNDLTEPMKTEILHSKINFQGEELSFNKIIVNNQEIINQLPSEDIRKILLKNENLVIKSTFKLYSKYVITNVSLKDSSLDEELDGEDVETIRSKINGSKCLLLSDGAGSGKTTFFQKCAKKLKEKNRDYWIAFLNLRNCHQVFEKYSSSVDELNPDDILQILVGIVNVKSLFEEMIFSELFLKGKTILLLDGFDEIPTRYTNLVTKIIVYLKENHSQNEYWISTRPNHENELQQKLNIPIFRFTILKKETILHFIEEILKTNNYSDEILKSSQDIYKIIEKLSLKNLLMIEMMTELYIKQNIPPAFGNIYSILSMTIKNNFQSIMSKTFIDDSKNKFSLPVYHVHCALALITMIGEDFKGELGFQLDELSIVKNWNKEKEKWSAENIVGYGLITVDLPANDLRSSFKFGQKIFADFFFAHFLISNLSDPDLKPEEVEKIFKMVDTFTLKEKEGFESLQQIFFSGIGSENDIKSMNLNEQNKAMILEKFKGFTKN